MPCSIVDESNKRGGSTDNIADTETDEALVAAAKTGDQRAFATLIDRYHSRMFALALRYTKLYEDAEDVVQQTFQKAFVSLPRFEGKYAFASWLTRVLPSMSPYVAAQSSCSPPSIYRRLEQSGRNRAELGPGRCKANPEASYIQREGAQIWSLATGELAPATRRALELQLRELSARETARHMGISVSALKAWCSRGRGDSRCWFPEIAWSEAQDGSHDLAVVPDTAEARLRKRSTFRRRKQRTTSLW